MKNTSKGCQVFIEESIIRKKNKIKYIMGEREVKDIVEDVVDVVEETYSDNAKTASED